MKKAVLMIHGFTGGTRDNEELERYLKTIGYDVFTFTLPGHDQKRIRNITAADWVNSSRANLELVKSKGYSKIILIGHSLGGTLVSILANEYKDDVSALILISPAFDFFRMNNGILKYFIKIFRNSSILFTKHNRECFSMLIKKGTITSIKEFIKVTAKYKEEILNIDIPILFIHGGKDKVIPINLNKEVFDKISSEHKEFMEIEGGSHWIFLSDKKDVPKEKIKEFLLNIK